MRIFIHQTNKTTLNNQLLDPVELLDVTFRHCRVMGRKLKILLPTVTQDFHSNKNWVSYSNTACVFFNDPLMTMKHCTSTYNQHVGNKSTSYQQMVAVYVLREKSANIDILYRTVKHSARHYRITLRASLCCVWNASEGFSEVWWCELVMWLRAPQVKTWPSSDPAFPVLVYGNNPNAVSKSEKILYFHRFSQS